MRISLGKIFTVIVYALAIIGLLIAAITFALQPLTPVCFKVFVVIMDGIIIFMAVWLCWFLVTEIDYCYGSFDATMQIFTSIIFVATFLVVAILPFCFGSSTKQATKAAVTIAVEQDTLVHIDTLTSEVTTDTHQSNTLDEVTNTASQSNTLNEVTDNTDTTENAGLSSGFEIAVAVVITMICVVLGVIVGSNAGSTSSSKKHVIRSKIVERKLKKDKVLSFDELDIAMKTYYRYIKTDVNTSLVSDIQELLSDFKGMSDTAKSLSKKLGTFKDALREAELTYRTNASSFANILMQHHRCKITPEAVHILTDYYNANVDIHNDMDTLVNKLREMVQLSDRRKFLGSVKETLNSSKLKDLADAVDKMNDQTRRELGDCNRDYSDTGVCEDITF